MPRLIAIAVAMLMLLGGLARGAERVDFNRDIRPILAANCFKCHGPDDKAREADLRLDDARIAAEVLSAGKPAESELLRRINAEDPDDRMPPPATKRTLTDRQKELLAQWIAQGAKYEEHWAFIAPTQPPLPDVSFRGWPRNGIDYFVLNRLEREGLKPSPEADRYTLARRVYLDLIGLPPTPEQADAFVNDPSPRAYADLVERLLASPHYGERWARRWLDLARYADTNGYEKDRPRSMWPYRDWVINAINEGMPFDQFTIEQIAGDMLPGATLDQRIATGFHRNTMLNEEGGIDPLEFRYYAVVDRINTTATTWLGLTLGCAQCHTHKFDPITHREYYSMMAFLNNANEPEIEVPSEEIAAKRAQIERKIATMESKLAEQFPADPEDKSNRPEAQKRRDHLDKRFAQWLDKERGRTLTWHVLRPTSATSNLPRLEILEDASVLASGDQSKADTYTLKYPLDIRGVTAIRLEVLPDERLPAHGPGRTFYEGRKGDFFLSEFRLKADGKPVELSGATESYGNLAIGRGSAEAKNALDGNQQSGWSTSGREGERHQAVFTLASPLSLSGGGLELEMLFERHYAAGLGRFRISVTTETGAVARDLPPEVERFLAVPDEQLSADQRDALLRQFLRVAPELADARKEIDKVRATMPEFPTTLVMTERQRDYPRPTFMHHRGEFLQPTDKVKPAVLSILHDLPSEAPSNRLGFARWLVDPANPLVGRVVMNRHWAVFFGQGIVRTIEDFGYQSSPPTHPDLLDWLAVEFVNQGWSLKDMHRLIVTSATYRQQSRVTDELLQRDPENRLLARGPRVRLDAELVRDSALKASGLLSHKVGGPSVYPPQPANITTEGAYGKLDWNVSEGADRYRRGLYTFMKRTAPYAMFSTFDGPSGEACMAKRDVSNTPLQALTLLNDDVFTEAAQALGKMIAEREGSPPEKAAYLFRRCLTRPPTAAELRMLVEFYGEQRGRIEAKEVDAAKIAAKVGGDVAERAAWTLVARAVMNLDEAIVKD